MNTLRPRELQSYKFKQFFFSLHNTLSFFDRLIIQTQSSHGRDDRLFYENQKEQQDD